MNFFYLTMRLCHPPDGNFSPKYKLLCFYSKTSFLVQIKFITEDSEQTQTQTLIIN